MHYVRAGCARPERALDRLKVLKKTIRGGLHETNFFLVIGMLIAIASNGFGLGRIRFQKNDEAVLKQLIKEWADAVCTLTSKRLDRFADDNFSGSAEGISFNKKMLAAAIRSGNMKVAAWDCNKDDMRVNVRGNAAIVTSV